MSDEGPVNKLSIGQSGTFHNTMWFCSGSKNRALVGNISHCLGALEGLMRRGWGLDNHGYSYLKRKYGPMEKSMLRCFDDVIKVGPNPLGRKSQLAKVANVFRAPDINFALTVQDLVGGLLKGVDKEMKNMKQRYHKSMEQAFDKAKRGGEKQFDLSRLEH